jgi:hypothetical protein
MVETRPSSHLQLVDICNVKDHSFDGDTVTDAIPAVVNIGSAQTACVLEPGKP